MKTYLSYSSAETKALGKKFTERAKNQKPRTKRKNAIVFALQGDLGSGKTTFVQGFLRALGIRKKITSPTFVLMKRYVIRARRFASVYHVDAYRLKNANGLRILGFEEILSDSRNIVLVEWGKKIKKLLPKNTIWIEFGHGKKENERGIVLKN